MTERQWRLRRMRVAFSNASEGVLVAGTGHFDVEIMTPITRLMIDEWRVTAENALREHNGVERPRVHIVSWSEIEDGQGDEGF